jgi:hypothetical protein
MSGGISGLSAARHDQTLRWAGAGPSPTARMNTSSQPQTISSSSRVPCNAAEMGRPTASGTAISVSNASLRFSDILMCAPLNRPPRVDGAASPVPCRREPRIGTVGAVRAGTNRPFEMAAERRMMSSDPPHRARGSGARLRLSHAWMAAGASVADCNDRSSHPNLPIERPEEFNDLVTAFLCGAPSMSHLLRPFRYPFFQSQRERTWALAIDGTALAVAIHSYARPPLWQTDKLLTQSTGSATRFPASSCTDVSARCIRGFRGCVQRATRYAVTHDVAACSVGARQWKPAQHLSSDATPRRPGFGARRSRG